MIFLFEHAEIVLVYIYNLIVIIDIDFKQHLDFFDWVLTRLNI